MKHILILVIVFSIYSCSGTYSKFRLTGTPFTALPEDKEIRVVQNSDPGSFEEIGIAEIKNSDKAARIQEAKRLARINGGEVIMPVKTKDEELADPDIEDFRVLSPIHNEEDNIVEEEIVEEEPAVVKEAKEKPDYSNLQVVPYKILSGEIASLKGLNFRDSMYPGSIINTPADIAVYSGKNTKLIELRKELRGNIVYLVSDNKNLKYIQRIIKSKKKLRFVYTPLNLSKAGIPVLKLIDVIE